MTGKKQKSKELYSDQSESDVHVSPRKKRHQYISPDSDLESYDESHEHSKEVRSKPFQRKLNMELHFNISLIITGEKRHRKEVSDSDQSNDHHVSRK